MDNRNRRLLAVLIALCVVVGGAYVAVAALGPDETTTDARPEAGEVLAQTDLMVRAVDSGNPRLNGRIYEVDGGRVQRRSGDLACERVYYAAGRGICMGVAASGVDYQATIFDSDLQPQHSISLTGFPSRARVSGDGRFGAMTVFVSGDAYRDPRSAFPPRRRIADMRSGRQVAQLEQFAVTKDGRSFDAPDFNFWGVTFSADPNRFYATLGTGEDHYLVEG